MTYFDPDVYDWKELKDDEEIFMRGYNCCIDEVECAFSNLISDKEFSDETPTLNAVLKEIKEDVAADVMDWIVGHRVEVTCSLMENNLEKYGEDYEE